MELSKRLQAVVNLVSPGNVVADIGCDHGYVSIYLIEQKIAPHVIAMDVNKGPLERANVHIASHGLASYIEVRLSDGTQSLREREVDTMICAGMGGRLMVQILQEGASKVVCMKELVLQPQSEVFLVRAYLREIGFVIVEEDMIFEEEKYYPMMRAIPQKMEQQMSEEQMSEIYDIYGKLLIQKKHPVFMQFLALQQKKTEKLILDLTNKNQQTEKQRDRIMELHKELEQIKAARYLMS